MAKTFEVTLRFQVMEATDPLDAAKKALGWILDQDGGAEDMCYEVKDEETGQEFSVDLSEDDEDAVLELDTRTKNY